MSLIRKKLQQGVIKSERYIVTVLQVHTPTVFPQHDNIFPRMMH